ncbi:MAG: M48 family metalloprotease, partial [Chloroflexota bacterium]|nr:M48 family metalloprotease [Chloroflexota bacterium]
AKRVRMRDHQVRLLGTTTAPEAFVAGPFRPAIFVSRALLDVLDLEELEAVLLHEEHHRRTRAPLRGLALACWSRLVGRLPAIRRWIDRRVAQLEIEADRYALAAGASSAAMASALIKCDRSMSPTGIGFASVADIRLRQLLGGGDPAHDPAAAPVEWLAPMLLALGLAACHLFG